MQTRDLGKPKSLLCFGRPGRRPLLLNRGYSPLKPSMPLAERSWGFGRFWYASVSEANKAIYGAPRRGTGFARHTKTLTKRVFPRRQLHPLHIGRGLGRVDASFSSFLRAEEKDRFKRTDFPGITNPHIRLSGITNPAERGAPRQKVAFCILESSFLYVEK